MAERIQREKEEATHNDHGGEGLLRECLWDLLQKRLDKVIEEELRDEDSMEGRSGL
jgi:hypothetical protein